MLGTLSAFNGQEAVSDRLDEGLSKARHFMALFLVTTTMTSPAIFLLWNVKSVQGRNLDTRTFSSCIHYENLIRQIH